MSGESNLKPIRRQPSMTAEQREAKNEADLERVSKLIGRLQGKQYYGKITISLEGGSITRLVNEQVLKIDDIG